MRLACRNKAQKYVFRAIKIVSARFPFEIAGIDSDNGAEFINNILIRYCVKNKINFTRSRPYKKNDIARTSFRRVLESGQIDDKIKARLKLEYDSLNPVKLKKNIAGLQEKLLKLNVLKSKVRKEAAINAEAYGYITG